MKACIVKPHYAGLFSLINNVITCMDIYDHVHVDWSEGCIYGNVWGKLFKPTTPPEGEHDILTTYPDQWLTYKNAGHLYLGGNEWRHRCNTLWNRLTVLPEIREEAERNAAILNAKGVIGVMVRSHPQGGEQLSNRSQTFDEFARVIERHSPVGGIYLMAGDWESLDWFGERFSVLINPCINRADFRTEEYHLTRSQTAEDAIRCLCEVLTISLLPKLIHPVSNMATAALYMNPALESIYLQ